MESSEDGPPPPVPGHAAATPAPAGPWGIWPTLGFSAAIAVAFIGVSFVVYLAFVAGDVFGQEQPDLEILIEGNGLALAASSLAASLTGALLVIGAAWLRRGIRIVDYLGLRWPGWRPLVFWTVLLVVIFTPLEWVRVEVLGQEDVPESMLQMYRSCSFLPILWMAVIIGAPVGEEFFFRGFLFEGIRHSKLGPITAVISCAVIWAVIHIQYDFIDMSVILLGGLFLGIARLKTGNLWVPVFLHFVWNLLSMIQTASVAGQSS